MDNTLAALLENLLHIGLTECTPEKLNAFQKKYCYDEALQPFITEIRLTSLISEMKANMIYEYRDALDICIFCFRYQDINFLAGPFVRAELSPQQLQSILMKHRIPSSRAASVTLFRSGFPMISSTQARTTLTACLKALSNEISEYSYYRVDTYEKVMESPAADYSEPLDYSTLYRRYDLENRFLQMIETGDTENVLIAYRNMSMEGLSSNRYVNAIYQDPTVGLAMVRALARKAAENGGASMVAINEITQRAVQEMAALRRPAELNACTRKMLMALTEAVRQSRLQTERYTAPVRKVIEFIHLNYSQTISLGKLASIACLADTYLCKIFKNEVGVSISQYITVLRCQHAAELLRNSQAAIQEISFYVGYGDNNYFVKVFKKEFGVTPTQYRKKNGKVRIP